MTGSPFSRDLTFWHDWWGKDGRAFVDQQFLIRVDPDQVSRTSIHYFVAEEGRSSRITLAGEGLINELKPQFEDQVYFISTEDMGSLVNFLYSQDFFERMALTGSEPSAAGQAFISMEVEDLARIVGSESVTDAGFKAMEEELAARIEDQRWQCLYPGGGLKQWWEDRYPWWKEEKDPAKRTRCGLEDFIPALEKMKDGSILQSVELLEELGALHDCLDGRDVKSLLSGLSKRYWKIDPVVEAVVGMILKARNPDFLESLILYLYGTYNREAFPLLRKAMIVLDGTRKSLDDPQWFVRAIAAEACTEQGETGISSLITLARDKVPDVRFAALRGLASLDSDEGYSVLMEVMTRPDLDAKKVILEALKGLQSSRTLALYGQGLEMEVPELWPLALEGLGEISSPRAAEMIEGFIGKIGFQHEAAPAGIVALVRMGGDPARTVLGRLYMACDQAALKKTILFARADLGETRVFPELLDCLLENTLRDKALDAMAYLLVADYGGALWRYRERWEKAPGESQAYFLK
ncbi:MAG: HEAT repeat domain-containing protein, partial [Planctomycetes bacterium]|nr:HEAT repeat domain-containing protein [Planctomycetota bacterium]